MALSVPTLLGRTTPPPALGWSDSRTSVTASSTMHWPTSPKHTSRHCAPMRCCLETSSSRHWVRCYHEHVSPQPLSDRQSSRPTASGSAYRGMWTLGGSCTHCSVHRCAGGLTTVGTALGVLDWD